MKIARSETLDVLGTSIRSDLRWDDHVFNVSKEAAQCLGFLKRCKKYFGPTDLRTIYVTYIRKKMEYISHLWAGASKCALDDKVASSITSQGHRRNVSCIVLFYKYYFGKCSSGLYELIPPLQILTRNTRLSGRNHAYTVLTMSHRTTLYRENSFFARTARLWSNLSVDIFPTSFNIFLFKAGINQYFLLSPPSI